MPQVLTLLLHMPLSLARLNERQRKAVLHGNGPLLVLAGAGSGKTSTMSYRIAHLIADRHVPAGAILGLSFTRKAAEELKERVKKLVTESSGKGATRGMTVTTFHSLCVRLLRAHADRLGYQKNFTILDQNDQIDLIRQILRHIKIDDRKFDPSTILFEIGQAKNQFLSPDQARDFFLGGKRVSEDYAIITANVYEKYLENLRALDSMDFDDLLYYAVKLLREHADVRAGYNLTFRHILVDEYQDTNPAQFKLIQLLTERHQNLCVVGDDDQSIYGWRGADATHILKFTHHYPGAQVVTLDQNYRSTSTILDAANEVISKNKNRHAKKLWSDKGTGEPIQLLVVEEDRAEAEAVAEEILKLAQENIEGATRQKRPWKDFAILYRSNPQSRLFEEALRLRQIPYKLVGAMSFLDRKEIKDVLSYWRLVVNEKDDSAVRRVLNWPARGIGKGSLDAMAAHAVKLGIPLFHALGSTPDLQAKAHASSRGFHSLVTSLRESLRVCPLEPAALASWARSSLEKIGAKAAIDAESEGDVIAFSKKWENVEELANAMGQLDIDDHQTGIEVLREYLARLLLDAMDEKENQEERAAEKDQVTLLTLHGAKGLEYSVVFVVGMEEGFLPHRRTIEEALDFSEERRLAYVGITRAKEKLFLTRAKNRIRYGKTVPRVPSRFLEDVPTALYVKRDESYSPDPNSKEEVERHETRVSGFLNSIRSQLK